MGNLNLESTHEWYTRNYRHWCPHSEGAYTGADSLLSALRVGWKLVSRVYREEILFHGARHTTLYHFILERDGEQRVMPVISNPFVVRLLDEGRLHIQHYNENLIEREHAERFTVQDRVGRLA